MKKILDKVLDQYELVQERREERFDRVLTQNVEAMSDRQSRKRAILILSGILLLIWAAVLIRPYDVLSAFEKVGAFEEKIIGLVIATIFGLGVWLTYGLFRMRFPDLNKRTESSEVMSSFADQESSTRNVRVWVMSVAGGFLHLLALAVTFGLLVSNGR